VGYVLSCIGRPGPVIAWLGDWQKQPKAESWMLYNLVVMLQRKGRFDQGREIIRHAVALRHGEGLHEVFRLWAAFEEALSGNIVQARQHLATLPTEAIQEHHRPVQIMTQLLIAIGQRGGDQTTLRQSVRTGLRTAFRGRYPCQAAHYVRHGYRRFMSVAAPRLGGGLFRLWGWWFYVTG
jgi:hypothetical protein